MSEVRNPFAVFLDLRGLALEAGYIYIGIENQDPETNPTSVYWDSTFSTLATQPIRTLAGVADRSGSPGKMFVDGKYSIRVRDSQGVQVYYSASEGETSAAAGSEYLIHMQFLGVPNVSQVMLIHCFDRAVSLPTDLSGLIQSYVGTHPGSTCVLKMYLNGVQFGTMSISTAGAVTISSTAETTVAGDVLLITSPGSSTSAADIGATFTLVTA